MMILVKPHKTTFVIKCIYDLLIQNMNIYTCNILLGPHIISKYLSFRTNQHYRYIDNNSVLYSILTYHPIILFIYILKSKTRVILSNRITPNAGCNFTHFIGGSSSGCFTSIFTVRLL